MLASWTQTQFKVAPKSPNVSQKRPQSVPKVLQSGPKMNQSYPSNQHGTDMDRQGADMKPTRTSKITRKNVYFLFMDPFGADNDTIQPAITHIIPAIRHLHARSCPKVSPKWTQSRRHMPKEIPKQPQIDSQLILSFEKTDVRCQSDPKVDPGVALAWTLQL